MDHYDPSDRRNGWIDIVADMADELAGGVVMGGKRDKLQDIIDALECHADYINDGSHACLQCPYDGAYCRALLMRDAADMLKKLGGKHGKEIQEPEQKGQPSRANPIREKAPADSD